MSAARPPYARVLAIAAGVDAPDAVGLRSAVTTGADIAARERLRLMVLATFGAQRLLPLLWAGAVFAGTTPPIPSQEAVRAEVDRRVLAAIAAVGADVALSWRCAAEPPCVALTRELAAMPDALVVIGCSGTRTSRRLARRLFTTAERCGSHTVVTPFPQSN